VILDRDATDTDLPRRFDVRHTSRALADLVAARAHRQKVEIALDLGAEPAYVLGFVDRIHAALLNLIINALDAMPHGGALRIAVTRGAAVRVEVCDTGQGVDAAIADEIWRLHYTTKAEGTGLGLYVTRAVAESHSGRATYFPNPNGGACFALELPVAPRA
jgi:signal transduction histidine kinase